MVDYIRKPKISHILNIIIESFFKKGLLISKPKTLLSEEEFLDKFPEFKLTLFGRQTGRGGGVESLGDTAGGFTDTVL